MNKNLWKKILSKFNPFCKIDETTILFNVVQKLK